MSYFIILSISLDTLQKIFKNNLLDRPLFLTKLHAWQHAFSHTISRGMRVSFKIACLLQPTGCPLEWLFFQKFFSKLLSFIISRDFFPKTPKIMNFPKNYPFEDCKFWHFSGLAQFSVLTYFHYFGFFGIILSRSMGENSVILKISPFGYTSLSKSCIWSFCHFCPMHNFLT